MPAAQSEETMHLFIDFLAEGRICQTVCACVSVRVRQSTFILCDRDFGGKKEESDSGLKRDEERRRARQEVHPWEPTHPLFVPVLSLMHWRVDMKHRATAKNEEKKKAAKKMWVNCQNNSEEYWRYDTGYLSFVYVIEDLEALALWRHKGHWCLAANPHRLRTTVPAPFWPHSLRQLCFVFF